METIDILRHTDIFYDLTRPQLEMIAGLCREKTARVGEMIFAENTPGDELYAIVRGEVEILVDPGLVSGSEHTRKPGPHTIATLRDGQTFGEVALVDKGLRSASARCAAEGTRLLVIPCAKLLGLCEAYSDLGYRVMRNVAADLAFKIRGSDMAIREQLLWRPRPSS